MTLNHINLPTTDIAASKEFYANYFGMTTVLEVGRNFLAIMRDDGGLVLNLSRFERGAGEAGKIPYPKDFHIGFFLETREEVCAVHTQMVEGGLAAEPPKKMAGRFAFYQEDPGGVVVEVARLEPAL